MSTKPQALVIEDDPAQNDIFCSALEQAGFDVQSFDDGQAALDYLQVSEHTPHLIVLDLHLPGQRGGTILETIRSLPHLKETRVLLATADPRMAEMVESNADLVLLKPVSFIQLRDLARRFYPAEYQ